ncbi:MAG: TIGR00645 family protein [Hyphomicrobiaceae bacterium]
MTYARICAALEKALEAFLFASRWMLAPIYAGLALSLVVLFVKFAQEFWHIAVTAIWASEAQVILGVLSLVDLAFTGSLLVIVIFSGYENFVSKIDHTNHRDWPEWMGTIDFTGLKLKLLSSIVAISAIQLLKQFMSLKTVTDREMFWYVVVHLVFVISSLMLALSDKIAGHGDKSAGPVGVGTESKVKNGDH